MRLVTGEIVEIRVDGWTSLAKARVGGACTRVPLYFVPEARVGDHILIESGVAIAIVGNESQEEP